MYSQELRIPKDRIGVLIGKSGEVKDSIAKKTKTKITIDSEQGDVIIEGEDPVVLYTLKDVVIAVGRGFSPQVAMELLKEEIMMEVINIQDFAGKSKKKLDRLRGRVIGAEGKSRTMLENLSQTHISVYGKTVAIVGEPEHLAMARNAVESLLSGSPHGNVYKTLEERRRELMRRKFEDGITS